jgi:hypothetical protein
VRLADDARGRVPFALVGVVLLVGASTFAVTLGTRGPAETDRRVEAAVDRATASEWSAVRTAVRRAARDAAAEPAIRPANTTFGRVLNNSTVFRDTLRIRAYVAARRALDATTRRQSGVTVTASLPPTSNASSLRAAKRRVRLTEQANGTGVQVAIEGIRVRVHRDGRLVATEQRTVRATVATPVLAMHERTQRYERRLNAEVDRPGLARRLSARLWPIVWARGYAQRYGAPIGNVLGSRHVGITTNGAVLSVQRSVFGREDPAGRHGYRRALVRSSLQAGIDEAGLGSQWVHAVVADPNQPLNDSSPELDVPSPSSGADGDDVNATLAYGPDGRRRAPQLADATRAQVERSTTTRPVNRTTAAPDRTMSVDVGVTADRAFLAFERGTNGSSIAGVVNRSYEADVRLATAVEETVDGDRPSPDPPGSTPGNWSLVGANVTTVSHVTPAEAPDPDVPDGWVGFDEFERRVTRVHEVTWHWRRTTGRVATRETTTGRWVERYRVGAVVLGRPAPPPGVPDRPIDPVFRRGGPLDGPNFRGVPEAGFQRLVAARGGRDAVAARAAAGRLNRTTATVRGDRPADLHDWIRADLHDLRRRVRNVSVNVSRGGVATTATDPSRELLDTLETRRRALVGAPETYDGVADRARTAVRAAYLERVLDRFRAQADRKAAADAEIGGLLGRFGSSLGEVRTARRARSAVAPPGRSAVDGLVGRVRLVPDGGPSYLSSTGVEDDHLPAIARGSEYRPLATVNVNPFTVPYQAMTQKVLNAGLSLQGRVPLYQAANTLSVANETLQAGGQSVPKLADHRDELRAGIAQSLRVYGRRSRSVLASRTNLSASARDAAVTAAFERWNTTARRGMAATNGSLAAAVAEEAVARGAGDRETLATRLRADHAQASLDDATTVGRPSVNRTKTVVVDAVKSRATAAAKDAVGKQLVRQEAQAFGKRFASIPAGLPILPVTGQWYATVNLWIVRVRGAYARFAVRTDRGRASAAGSETRYVREAGPVALDVDADGDDERLAWNDRITFASGTVVAVAVPPYGAGVGDAGGDIYETSPGWPAAGCVRNGTCFPHRVTPPRDAPDPSRSGRDVLPADSSGPGADPTNGPGRRALGNGSRDGSVTAGRPHG